MFIESLKANFNVNSAVELCLRKLRALHFNKGDDIIAHLARFNDVRLTARIQYPDQAMPYLLDSIHNVFGEELAKVAVFSPSILTDYETLNRWLLSIHDAVSKTRFFNEVYSVKYPSIDRMDLSSLTIAQINQSQSSKVKRPFSGSFGWKSLPPEDYRIFQAYCKKFKICIKCRDYGFTSGHTCRAINDGFKQIPTEIYKSYCLALEQCGLCVKCRDLSSACSCNKATTVYVRSLLVRPNSKTLCVKIKDVKFTALIDTGSEPCLILKDSIVRQLQIQSSFIDPINIRTFTGDLVEQINSKTTLTTCSRLLLII